MTSSLVGSEMCIRDRERGRQARAIRRMHVSTNSQLEIRVRSKPEGTKACLLYTSDAADDM
eukprot:8889064-Prorocentrum_lima.AAC.1